MKSVFTEKKNVAWFTLAECVARGERERAFGVYRLLSHSLDDRALAAQLEGDLLCAFNMPDEALERYDRAMRVYKQNGKLLEAAAVCEHMRFIAPDNLNYTQEALVFYSIAQSVERVAELLCEYVAQALQQGGHENSHGAACTIAQVIENLHGYARQGFCHEQVMNMLAAMVDAPAHVRTFYAQKTANAYVQHGSGEELKKFLSRLQTFDEEFYRLVLKQLQD